MTINPPLEISVQNEQLVNDNPEMRSLIERCIDNDRVAQAELYKQHHGKLMALCLRYFSNRDDALSVLNQGFLKIFKNLKSYDPAYDFGGWAYRIVQRTAIDQLRKQLRLENRMGKEEPDEDVGVSPDAIKNLYAKDLISLLHKLPPATRAVFNLFAIEGYSHSDISNELSMSEGTSKWHVNNARKLLKQWIEKQ